MTSRSKDKAARHVRLYHWLLRSEAWQSLSANARALYIEMAARYNGSNNGRIPFSVRDAAKRVHIGKNAALAAFTALQQRGFIIVTKRSAFSVKTKSATEWRLTEFSSDTDHSFATKDFMRWSPDTVPVAGRTVPVAGQYGTCSETVVTKVPRNSTRSGTVKAENSAPRSRHGYTYSLPGGRGHPTGDARDGKAWDSERPSLANMPSVRTRPKA
jgi:hypothetical protein